MSDEIVPVKKVKRHRVDRSTKLAKAIFGVRWGKMEGREDREALCLVLLRCGDEKLRAFAQEALLPQFKRDSLAHLCEKWRISFKDIARAYTETKKDEGFMRAADHLPDLIEQTAIDAKSRWDKCLDCNGTGKTTVQSKDGGPFREVVCKPCRGSGSIYTLGNDARLKLMFETFVADKRIAGPLVNLDLRSAGRRESIEDLSQSVQRDVIDAIEPTRE